MDTCALVSEVCVQIGMLTMQTHTCIPDIVNDTLYIGIHETRKLECFQNIQNESLPRQQHNSIKHCSQRHFCAAGLFPFVDGHFIGYSHGGLIPSGTAKGE